MASFLAIVRDVALLIVRVGLGGLLLLHGWFSWQGAGGVPRVIASFGAAGMPYAEVIAWGSVILELVGGVFLIVGALTPLVAALIVVQQVLLLAYVSLRHFSLTGTGAAAGSYQYDLVVGLLALLLLVFGAGRIAVDQLFRRAPETTETPASAAAPGRVGATV